MALSHLELNSLTELIIGAAIEVHRNLGPGLLEAMYEEPLYWELTDRGLAAEVERPVPVPYKSRVLRRSYRVDMIVNGLVLLEIKAVEKTLPIHKSQVVTYLKICNLRVGLLMNFNVERMIDGIARISV